ncbi:MAG: DUF4838 domain-containing protein [Planctomycetes bacterium]|nr:DUF4838 domain-containing protein [Planctomycetota bacterium]
MKKVIVAVFLYFCVSPGPALAEPKLAIVVRPTADIVGPFAAAELQGYLEKTCGKKFPILAEKTPESVNLVIRGADAAENLGPDGFIIRTEGNDLLLLGGGPRGKLYAVYEFIEKYVGVRWFNAETDDELVPKRPTDEIVALIKKGIHDKQVPSFAFREISPNLGPDYLSALGKRRFNAVRCGYGMGSANWKKTVLPELRKRGIDLVMGGHDTYRRFLSPKKYFVEHPEWSILRKGKRVGVDTLRGSATFCTTNKEALATFLKNLAEHIKKCPEVKYLYPWPSDGAKWCECEQCKKIPISDRLLALDMAIANAVKKVRPDMIVIHFAYGSHMEVPENLRPPKAMALGFSAWGRNFHYALDDERCKKKFRDALTGWSKICNEGGNPMYIHSKHARLYGIGFMLMPFDVTQRDFRYLKGLGVDGFDFHRGSYGWWTKGLNDLVVAKLAWNCDADANEIIDDWFQNYWGPMHKEVKEIFLCVKKALPDRRYWAGQTNPNLFHTNIEGQPRYMPRLVRPDVRLTKVFLDETEQYNENSLTVLRNTLAKIRRLCESNKDPILAKRLKKLEKAFAYVLLQREGIRLFLDLRKVQITISASAKENLRQLNAKTAILDKLEVHEKKIQAMCTKENRRAGILWDNGQPRLDMVKEWRESLAKQRALFEADAKVEDDIVWQIGKFYGTFKGDMGSGAGHPTRVTYRIPDDWTLGRDASDFPQRHNEPSKKSACRYDIVFKAGPGKYLLTVAHGTSAKSETVRVLLDGQEVGKYTTQNKERSVRADFSLEIKGPGKHTITLTEPDEEGGGYELDAIRLIRVRNE